jgi:hypothetical protein
MYSIPANGGVVDGVGLEQGAGTLRGPSAITDLAALRFNKRGNQLF